MAMPPKSVKCICIRQTGQPDKELVLEKLQYDADGTIEYRFGWYRVHTGQDNVVTKRVWGRTAPTIPLRDLRRLIAEALVKGWL